MDRLLSTIAKTMSGIALGAFALATMARADLVYVNYPTALEVPVNDPGGLFLNVVTGQTGDTADAVPGWDLEIAQLNQGDAFPKIVFTTPRSGPGGATGFEGAKFNSPLNLDVGTYIGPDSSFYNSTADFAFQNVPDNPKYAGFDFYNENTNSIDYGWLRLFTTAPGGGFPAYVQAYAYDDAGAPVYAGVVPEPSTWAMVGLGALSAGVVVFWRRGVARELNCRGR